MAKNIYNIFFHNISKLQTTQISTSNRLRIKTVESSYNGIVHNNIKEQTTDTRNNATTGCIDSECSNKWESGKSSLRVWVIAVRIVCAFMKKGIKKDTGLNRIT